MDYDKVKMERMADAIANNRIRDLWKMMQQIKGHNNVKSCSVDGHVTKEEITQQVFGKKI